MDEKIVFAPGAFKDLPKEVPLVMYQNDGTRKVIGKTVVTETKNGLRFDSVIFDTPKEDEDGSNPPRPISS